MKKGLVVVSYLLLLLLAQFAAAPHQLPPAAGPGQLGLASSVMGSIGAGEPLRNGSDGSRANPVHLIPLFTNDPVDENKTLKIAPDDKLLLPFSTRRTCSECHIYEHNYKIISKGWHFNATDPNVSPGRPGQPWILVDAAIATQIPLSYRQWPGTFKPEQIGITPFQFTGLFGRQMPGGSVGEIDSVDVDEISRQMVSGKLEINCLICHDADPAYDPAEYASQIANQNFRWAATGACGIASVSGSAEKMTDTYEYTMPDMLDDPELMPLRPTVTYRENAFDHKNQVFFDIVREVPNQRCYFCHSNVNVDKNGLEKWTADEDVHLTAGMTCVDCHREGLGHNTIRGYEGEDMVSKNPLAAASTCRGCHLGADSSAPQAGRLGAPVPEHLGIPPIHFEKLTCTACHSGPWPGQSTYRCKNSQAHALGTHNVNKSPDVLPHIFYPVFAKQGGIIDGNEGTDIILHDSKIGPHKLLWPAYWAALKDKTVMPIALETVRQTVGKIITKEKLSFSGDWPSLNEKDINEALNLLGKSVEGKPVYISGGKLYRLDDSGELCEEQDHPAAKPYMWPFAHDVRPAAQSLGARWCEDCHSPEAPFFKGLVCIDSPVQGKGDVFRKMMDMYEVDGSVYVRVNWFFKLLIIGVMTLLILHILGDLYRRGILWLTKRVKKAKN